MTIIPNAGSMGLRMTWAHGHHSGTITFPGEERGPVYIDWYGEQPDNWGEIEAEVEKAATDVLGGAEPPDDELPPYEYFDAYIAAVEGDLPPGGRAAFEPYTDDELELVLLSSDCPGSGWGTEAMRIIVFHADRLSINLMVIPAGWRRPSPRLAEFYRRFGFEGEDALHRPHQRHGHRHQHQ